ncbi:chymotrypsin-elastase inhibitor ixodidin-like [Tropilaelaps mercedesae]|uniref:Chymotrypsin-elastase inhibitor ixodidin-like n=1 Tax=Tropilaelaps mercedesae TaxID=418985 RepID=A0A1V9X1I0_9ACAR|nr:chymotrypsin-elastase inhibitor ixodidin-like [Tropilaelaps mercedesae]
MKDISLGNSFLLRLAVFACVAVAAVTAMLVHEVEEDEEICMDAPKEVYFFCGSTCEPTCANPQGVWCTKRCVPGCFCRKGFVRLPNGRCGHPTDCRRFR